LSRAPTPSSTAASVPTSSWQRRTSRRSLPLRRRRCPETGDGVLTP
jgi:hypothetical protein